MSSRKGGGKPSVAGTTGSSSKGSGIAEGSSTKVDQLMSAVAATSINSAQVGEWETVTRKSKNRGTKPWVPQDSNSKAWGHPDVDQKLGMQSSGKAPGNSWPTINSGSRRPAGRGNLQPQSSSGGFGNNNLTSQQVIPLPLEHGWNWSARAAAGRPSEDATRKSDIDLDPHPVDDNGDKIVNDNNLDKIDTDCDDDDDDDDDDELTDEYDSDVSEKSHESRKNSKWFKGFFENLDNLTLEEIHGPARQWHCPACKDGPGAIDWYRGLQPLTTHAKTKGSKRVKLHRDFAEILDEELRRRGTSVIPSGETFGKWKGLNDTVKDRSIVWPPMVVIMNTRLEQDENDKWIGMGNQELLDSFSSYAAEKARHSYGPQGHRGMSVLIFESSAVGFLEAERLHDHFQEQGRDKEAWDRHPSKFYPGGKRQLYGYMAEKDDLEDFNKHCHGKSPRLKFETRSYQEMVVNQLRQMNEDNQQLIWYKDKAAKEKRRSKAFEESLGKVAEKLRKTTEENRIVRQRSKIHHEQNKEEMDFQEQFFKDQLKIIHEARDAKEDSFERIQQEEREKVKQSSANLRTKEDHSRRAEYLEKFIKSQDKEMEEFEYEREKLEKIYADQRISMKQRHQEEEFELEKKFDADLDLLMKKYTPHHSNGGNSNDQ